LYFLLGRQIIRVPSNSRRNARMKTHLICRSVAIAILFSLGILGCSVQEPPKEEATGPAPVQPTTAADEDHVFDARLLEIAHSYKNYQRVGDNIGIPIAPCAFGPGTAFHSPNYSASQDSPTHGRKLYWLYVKEKPSGSSKNDYVVPEKPNPVGQIVVKEAWVPEEVKLTDEESPLGTRDKPFVEHEGHIYRQGDLAGLFIMYKLDPKTPGTDEGWVYGTVSADGKTVTSAGRVQSCMNCHQDAPHDRLFGVAKK
jgi:hypothetical protein